MKKNDLNFERREENGVLSIIVLFFFVVGFFVGGGYMTGNGSHDFLSHAGWGNDLYLGKTINYSAPLWHYFVALLLKTGGGNISLELAASIANGLFFSLSAVALYKFSIIKNLKEIWLKAFIVILVSIVGPLRYLPIVPYYYLGSGTPNVWHNPTYMAVKGISVLVVFLFLEAYLCGEKDRVLVFGRELNKKIYLYTITGVLSTISVFLKPSFIQGFLPSLCVFLFLELFINKDKKFADYVKDGLFITPCIVLIVLQFVRVYVTGQTGGNSVGIELFKVLHKFTRFPIKAFFIANAFPLFILAVRYKKLLKDKYSLFVLLYLLVSFAEISLLYETGSRMFHFNFGWGYYLSQLMVWIVAITRFTELVYDKNLRKPYETIFGGGLLTLHIVYGVYYFYNNIYLLHRY